MFVLILRILGGYTRFEHALCVSVCVCLYVNRDFGL